jgi:hypothetical protein
MTKRPVTVGATGKGKIMSRFAALASILLLTSTLNAAPFGWPNPLNADVYGLSNPSPQSIAIPWSQANQRYQFSNGSWTLTIGAAIDGFFPVSLLDPPAPMKIVDASNVTLATFDVFYNGPIYTEKTYSASPNTNVIITSIGVPEPSLGLLAVMLTSRIRIRKRR